MSDKRTRKAADDEAAVVTKIAGWPEPHRAVGERLHQIIMDAVPELQPRLWYGMPGYAKGGPVLLFFNAEDLISFGLTEKANTSIEDDANDQLVEAAWFVTGLDGATERRIAAIARKAAS